MGKLDIILLSLPYALVLLAISHFVPNLTIGPPIIQSLRSHFPSAFLDCHLMIENPELWVERVYKAGASSITFHLEATTDPVLLAQKIKSFKNCLCSVAIKPDTPVSDIPTHLLPLLDMILVMTVEPGFGGQKLIESCANKVKELRYSSEIKFDKFIQVDGGVDETNVEMLKSAGANVIVAGSSIFKSSDPQSVINFFKFH